MLGFTATGRSLRSSRHVVLTVAATVAAVLARWVARPLDRLEQAADAVGSGNLAARAPAEGPREVRRLAETFNSMALELDTLIRSQDAFVADASTSCERRWPR